MDHPFNIIPYSEGAAATDITPGMAYYSWNGAYTAMINCWVEVVVSTKKNRRKGLEGQGFKRAEGLSGNARLGDGQEKTLQDC